jgi:hypothetical protein
LKHLGQNVVGEIPGNRRAILDFFPTCVRVEWSNIFSTCVSAEWSNTFQYFSHMCSCGVVQYFPMFSPHVLVPSGPTVSKATVCQRGTIAAFVATPLPHPLADVITFWYGNGILQYDIVQTAQSRCAIRWLQSAQEEPAKAKEACDKFAKRELRR